MTRNKALGLSFFTALVFIVNVKAAGQNVLTNEDWLEDFDTLVQLVTNEHVKPYWVNKKDDFDILIQNSRHKMDRHDLKPRQCIIELMKLIAFTRDGHSNLKSASRYRALGYLPFTASWYDGHLYITRTVQPFEEALGAKILAIDRMPINDVFKKLRTIVPHANESRFRKFSPYYLHLPGALFGLGVTSSPDKATLLLEDENGAKFRLEFTDMPPEKEEKATFVNLTDRIAALPYYQKNADKAYWFEYLEKEKILYFKYNRVTSKKEESVWAFARRMFDFVESQDIEKFVVDVRDNGGGSNAFSAPIWKGIEMNSKINRPGKLFVITGHKTFSAAINFVSFLERRTAAIIVGDAPGDCVHHPGDARTFTLPNSGLEIALSQLFHEGSFYLDGRKAIEPDHIVPVSFADLTTGKDPVLDFIRNYTTAFRYKKVKPLQNYTGRYWFSPDTRLVVKESDSGLEVEITGKVRSPLYHYGKRSFKTEIKGLLLKFDKSGDLSVCYPDGKTRQIFKTGTEDVTFTELIYLGRFADAEKLLIQLKAENPEDGFWKDHSLAALALEIYYDLKDKAGREKAKATAKAVLNIAIRVNPENHAFAEESLRYY